MGYFSVCVCSLEYYRRKVHEKSDDFDQLKLRAGFGIVGNQNIDDLPIYLYIMSAIRVLPIQVIRILLFPMGDVVLQILVGRNKTMEFRSRYGFLTE